jgi:hypothetical protein
MRINSTSQGIFLEYKDHKEWVINILGNETLIDISSAQVMLSLLPFLEMGRDKITQDIKEYSLESSFPFDKFIEAGLRNGSEHWCYCAMEWLEEADIELIAQFESRLNEIYLNKSKYGQQTRHKAKSIIKKIV